MNCHRLIVSFLLIALSGAAAAQQSKDKAALKELEDKHGVKVLLDESKERVIGLKFNVKKLESMDIFNPFGMVKGMDLSHLEVCGIIGKDMTEGQLVQWNRQLKDPKNRDKVVKLVFDLSGTNVNLKWLRVLEDGLKFVKGLKLGATNIGDEELDQINKFGQLRVLNLTACTKITGVARIKDLSNLSELYLRSANVSNADMKTLSMNHKLLQRLELAELKNLTDDGVKELIALKESLRILDLSLSKHVTNRSVPYLERLTNLKTLDLTETKITNNKKMDLRMKLPGCTIKP